MGNSLNIGNSKGIKYELDKELFTGDYWVDGRPIYFKLFHIPKGQLPNDGWKDFLLDLNGASALINSNLNVLDYPDVDRLWHDGNPQFQYYVSLKDKKVRFSATGGWGNQEAYLTVYYTK